MIKIERLLVATDLSARSDRAVERAVVMAAASDAKLTVLHVVSSGLSDIMADRQIEDALRQIRDHLESLPLAKERSIDVKIVVGQGSDDILDAAEDLDADLIVLGIHRNETAISMSLGATVERVIKMGTRPVLVVKSRARHPYWKIMIGVDFSEHSQHAAEFALRLNRDAEFILVHAYDVPFKGFMTSEDSHAQFKELHAGEMKALGDAVFEAAKGTDGRPVHYSPVMRRGSAHQVIREQVERSKPDVLVIGTHGRTGIAHALLGSVAKDLIRSQPCDVLAVKARQPTASS